MSHLRTLVCAVIGHLFVSAGCASPSAGADDAFATHEVPLSGSPDSNRILTNGMPSDLLVAHRSELVELGGRTLSSHDLSRSPLIGTPEGRRLLGYIVKCALGWDDTIQIPSEGTTYVLEGSVGLAKQWSASPLSTSNQRWITACLLAHANAYGVEVPLSLRGDHPALAVTADEVEKYPVEEGAYYGDLFNPADEKPLMFACAGAGQKDSCEIESNAWLDARACAVGNGSNSLCGFYVPGDCYDFVDGAPSSCSGVQASHYDDCYPSKADRITAEERSAGYAEVITVYLRRSEGSACGSAP